jgi:hypothetical protein
MLFCLVLVWANGQHAMAQQNRPPNQIDHYQINKQFYSYVTTAGKNLLLKECGEGCLFIRFTTDEKGRVIDPESNEGAWQLLDTFVISALRATNGLWPVIKDKNGSVLQRTYLLPIWYNTGNCRTAPKPNPNSAAELIASMPVLDTAALDKDAKKVFYYSFMHMTDFRKKAQTKQGKFNVLECILLPPFYITGIVI